MYCYQEQYKNISKKDDLDEALDALARTWYEDNYTNHSDTSLLVNEFVNPVDVENYFRDGRDGIVYIRGVGTLTDTI